MSKNESSSNVVAVNFNKTGKPTQTPRSEWVVVQKQKTIHTLTQQGIGKIYWERNTGAYSHAIDFFRILATERSLRIIYDFHDTNKIIKLNVIEWEEYECELSVEQFIYLTHTDPSQVSSPQDYVINWLEIHNIKNKKLKESIHITRTILREDEIDIYHPDAIKAFIIETGDFYGCELKNHLGPIGYGESQNFAGDIYDVTLLDLMIAAYDDAEINGNPSDRSSMEVTYIEVWETTYTEISSKLLEQVIHEAILRQAKARWEFIYLNLSPSDARTRYFQKVSIPKLI